MSLVYLLHQALDRSATHYPDNEAFCGSGAGFTYAELAARSNQLAHFLRDRGVSRGDRVGVYMSRVPNSALAVFGILKAGAVVVPVARDAPPQRIRDLISNCKLTHLIIDPLKPTELESLKGLGLELLLGLPQSDIGVLCADWDQLDSYPCVEPPEVTILGQDLAYIIYTSGSTGVPKGIMHTHFSGLSYARMSVETYKVTHEDRIGNHSPLHFDMSTFGYFAGPLAGATTVLIPKAYTKFPASLSQFMEKQRISIWYSVPFALIQLLERGVLESRNLDCLRWIKYGGEPFAPKHIRALMELWPQVRFSNVYGPAEVNQCTYFHVDSPPTDELPIPVGPVWTDTEALVLDQAERPVGVGGSGELVVRSGTAMRGYWGEPERTEKSWYRVVDESGLERVFYRTGDLVEVKEGRCFVFLGRCDRQVKIRGHRVELDGIESLLSTHPEIEEAGVFPVRYGGRTEIQAAVICVADSNANPMELRRFLIEKIPAYSVPEKLTISDSLPRTTSGKIDRRELQRAAEAASNYDD